LSLQQAEERLKSARGWGLTDVHIVGGLNRELDLNYYLELRRTTKRVLPTTAVQALTAVEAQWLSDHDGKSVAEVLAMLKAAGLDALPGGGAEIFSSRVRENICPKKINAEEAVWLHSLSPAEVLWLAQRSHLTLSDTLVQLREAGLDSLPGGGAEILVDEVRQRVSPAKIATPQWLEVMETAQGLGMHTTATMVCGLGETTADRVQHLLRVRDLQDRTGGFRAFIPWSFQSNHTRLSVRLQTGVDYLRMVALSRLVLDNVEHIQAGWVTEGPYMAQIALTFGADDFGGVLQEMPSPPGDE